MEDWRSLAHLGFSMYEAEKSGLVRKITNKQLCFHMKAKDHRYVNLNLKRDGGTRHSQVKLSDLIANIFIGLPPTPDSEVIHIDGDTFNSHVNNLKWGTKEEKRDVERGIYRSTSYLTNISLPNEEWKDCSTIGLQDYLASSFGRIYSMKTGKVLSGNMRPDGYWKVDIVQNSQNKKISTHKIVCRTFHGDSSDPSYTVDHIDRNKSNNLPSNLRWASRSDQNLNKNPVKFVKTVARIRNNFIIQIYEEDDALELFELDSFVIPETGIMFDGDLWIYTNLTNLDFEGEQWASLHIDEITIEVSNTGRVKSRYGKTIGYTSNEGYKSIKLSGKSYLVHRLVVMAFKGKIPDELVVNHIDEDKTNNRLDNLEIVTKSENTNYSIKPGNNLIKSVKQLSLTGEVIATFPSIKEASDSTGVSYSGISKVVRGTQKTSGNFMWQYN
ncbi:HNH endonuclease [uncultured virus]|nr:HNH endonuclease [uncultured virus]